MQAVAEGKTEMTARESDRSFSPEASTHSHNPPLTGEVPDLRELESLRTEVRNHVTSADIEAKAYFCELEAEVTRLERSGGSSAVAVQLLRALRKLRRRLLDAGPSASY